MKKFSELSLFRRMLSMFLFVFSYTLLITLWFILPVSTDKGATLASCLNTGATLYAAVVAYLLLDNWKEQHRANYFSDLGKDLILQLKKTHGYSLDLTALTLDLKRLHCTDRPDRQILIEQMHNAVYRNIENITKSNNDLMHEGLFYLKVKDNQLLKSYLTDYYDHINSLFDEICDVVGTKGGLETDKLLSDLENINDNFVDISRKYVGELISLIKKDSCL